MTNIKTQKSFQIFKRVLDLVSEYLKEIPCLTPLLFIKEGNQFSSHRGLVRPTKQGASGKMFRQLKRFNIHLCVVNALLVGMP